VDQRDATVRRQCIQIGKLQCDYEILGLVTALKDHPQVEWKESIKEVITRYASR
jgi:hypothetical protein